MGRKGNSWVSEKLELGSEIFLTRRLRTNIEINFYSWYNKIKRKEEVLRPDPGCVNKKNEGSSFKVWLGRGGGRKRRGFAEIKLKGRRNIENYT